jgi:hypothetical protein
MIISIRPVDPSSRSYLTIVKCLECVTSPFAKPRTARLWGVVNTERRHGKPSHCLRGALTLRAASHQEQSSNPVSLNTRQVNSATRLGSLFFSLPRWSTLVSSFIMKVPKILLLSILALLCFAAKAVAKTAEPLDGVSQCAVSTRG